MFAGRLRISAQIMGHKPSALAEKHYRKRPIDMLRMWHTKIEKFILDEAGIAQPEESTKRLRAVSVQLLPNVWHLDSENGLQQASGLG